MDEEQRKDFDYKLDTIRNADEIAEKERAQRLELARLNAHRQNS